MKSMARPYPPEKCWKREFSILSLWESEKTKKSEAFAVSFGSDIPAGLYSLVLCDLSWDAMAPYTHAIVVHEGLLYMGEHPKIFSVMVPGNHCPLHKKE